MNHEAPPKGGAFFVPSDPAPSRKVRGFFCARRSAAPPDASYRSSAAHMADGFGVAARQQNVSAPPDASYRSSVEHVEDKTVLPVMRAA